MVIFCSQHTLLIEKSMVHAEAQLEARFIAQGYQRTFEEYHSNKAQGTQ